MRIIQILKDWLTLSFRKKKRILDTCQLNYIPERLHTNNREANEVFYVGELLFFRCPLEKLPNPYLSITLTELSHNRRGIHEAPISESDDVLYNTRSDKNFERHEDTCVITISIVDLDKNNQFDKRFIDKNNNHARIKLLHDPVPCMFPH